MINNKINTEIQTAYLIKRELQAGARALPEGTAERLRAARERALAKQRKTASSMQLAASAAPANVFLEWAGHLVPVVALALGLCAISYWHQSNRAEENAEIDTQMLIDELPPQAYADKGFGAWIQRGAE